MLKTTPRPSWTLPTLALSALALAAASVAQTTPRWQLAGQHHLPPIDPVDELASGDVTGDGAPDLVFATNGELGLAINDGTGSYAVTRPSLATLGVFGVDHIAIADLDDDDDADLVVALGGALRVFENDGTGGFTDATADAFGGATVNATRFRVGDVTGEGSPDLMVDTGTAVAQWHNDGSGTFTLTGNAVTVTSTLTLAALADAEGDGDLDVLVEVASTAYSSWLEWYPNLGEGQFGARAARLGSIPGADFAFADIDGDGDLDRVAPGPVVVPQTSAFQFAAVPIIYGTTVTSDLLIADMENDGDLDLIGTTSAGPRQLWRNDGTGTLALATSTGLDLRHFEPPLAVDVDGDGDRDLIERGRSWRLLLQGPGIAFVDATASPDTTNDLLAPRAAVTGDVNGDGWLDVVVASDFVSIGASGENFLYVNDGKGGLVSGPPLPGPFNDTAALALADFDGDGDLDMIEGTGRARLLNNDGTGRFTATTGLIGLGVTEQLATADLDGDGDIDVLRTESSQRLEVQTNDGTGVFTRAFAASLTRPTTALVVADLNRDGAPDALVAAGALQTYVNDGGQLQAAQRFTFPILPDHLAVADFDGDGDPDAIGARTTPTTPNVFLLENDDGLLVDATATAIPAGVHGRSFRSLAVGDVDLDGDPDVLLVANTDAVLLRNDGNGRFTGEIDGLPALFRTDVIALADFDADQDLDLFMAIERPRLYRGLTRGLRTPRVAAPGRPYEVELYAQLPAQGAGGGPFAVPLVSLATATLPLPPFGVLGVAPATLAALDPVALTGGQGTLAFNLPAATPLGTTLVWQAAVVHSVAPSLVRLTEVSVDQVVAY
ncbi:MAG: VCBS repeat-containing protein [Planctomycetota bacterium]